jgi:hypothetical protein
MDLVEVNRNLLKRVVFTGGQPLFWIEHVSVRKEICKFLHNLGGTADILRPSFRAEFFYLILLGKVAGFVINMKVYPARRRCHPERSEGSYRRLEKDSSLRSEVYNIQFFVYLFGQLLT